MAVELRRFAANEIYLDQDQAFQILRFFWPGTNVSPGSLGVEDRNFAQGLIVEAVDASYKMSYVQSLFESFFMKVPGSFGDIKKMLKAFLKKAAKNWFKHATGKDLEDPKIYESVRSSLARNFRSTWAIRESGGDLTY